MTFIFVRYFAFAQSMLDRHTDGHMDFGVTVITYRLTEYASSGSQSAEKVNVTSALKYSRRT